MPVLRQLRAVRLLHACKQVEPHELSLAGGNQIAVVSSNRDHDVRHLPTIHGAPCLEEFVHNAIHPLSWTLSSGHAFIAILKNVCVDAFSGVIFDDSRVFLDSIMIMDPHQPARLQDLELRLAAFSYDSLFSVIKKVNKNDSDEMTLCIDQNMASSITNKNIEEPAIFMRRMQNYYHFFLEDFPGILNAKEFLPLDALKVCVGLPFQSFQIEALERAGIRRSNIVGVHRHILRFETLVVISPLGTRGTIGPQAPALTRQLFRDAFDTDTDGPSVIYVTRQDAQNRRIANEPDILAALKNFDVHIMSASGMSVVDQARLLRSARIIIGPHGAGLTNVIFSDQAKIIELSPTRWVHCFWYLSSLLNRPHHIVPAVSELQLWNKDFASGGGAANPIWMEHDPAVVEHAVTTALGMA